MDAVATAGPQLLALERELSGPGAAEALARHDAVLLGLENRLAAALRDGVAPDDFPKLTELRAFKKHGIAVADWGVSSADFFSRAAGIWFSVFNPTDKVIDNIVIDVIGYDYGGKKIATRAGETVTLTSERRIAPDGTARLQFGRIWNADRLSRVEIKEITVTYDDGTTRRVKNIDKVTVPEELGNYFNLRGNGRDTMFDPFGW